MNDTDKNARLPISNVTVRETLREMALDMEIALYRRYSVAEATKILNISESELASLRTQGQIAYLQISDKHADFFGCQLLTYLLECVVPVGAEPRPRRESMAEPVKPAISTEAELLSAKETMTILGIKRTKFYALKNAGEIKTVKIGGRTLIRREELKRFIDSLTE